MLLHKSYSQLKNSYFKVNGRTDHGITYDNETVLIAVTDIGQNVIDKIQRPHSNYGMKISSIKKRKAKVVRTRISPSIH